MNEKQPDDFRKAVRNVYGEVAEDKRKINISNEDYSQCTGYSEEQLRDVPEEAQMGLGCGNPLLIAALKPGEVVLDLGCGGGFDCFLAASEVGENGRVIGVDMTPEMIGRARESAYDSGYSNVEFRLGEIEYLPIPDESIDVILSNCVINLSPDKAQVFLDAYRVLKPGGRLAIEDVVAIAPLPLEMKTDTTCVAECVAGAASIDEIKNMLLAAGFKNIKVVAREESREMVQQWIPDSNLEDYILAATIEAKKPSS